MMKSNCVSLGMTALLLAAACRREAAESPAADPAGGVITMWTDSTELFMEHPALLVGDSGVFALESAGVRSRMSAR